ncbi:hypothetical protein FOZ60_013725 [Perkinsus olseni]|uniref:Uncharacterized protein n=2 Tax=Perkinsus olseni TaxID=32597 RepID=A0A7J6P8C1_PEROL|nr:hypothetical protein FOZ60_013725 [Perkinsus olseni]
MLADELLCNPFLRVEDEAIQKRAAELTKTQAHDLSDVFAQASFVYASLKNLVPARALQSLAHDHLEKGIRVYQDAAGGWSTVPASTDGSDQSKILLQQAQDLPLDPQQGSSSSSSRSPLKEGGSAAAHEGPQLVEANAPPTVRSASIPPSKELRPGWFVACLYRWFNLPRVGSSRRRSQTSEVYDTDLC